MDYNFLTYRIQGINLYSIYAIFNYHSTLIFLDSYFFKIFIQFIILQEFKYIIYFVDTKNFTQQEFINQVEIIQFILVIIFVFTINLEEFLQNFLFYPYKVIIINLNLQTMALRFHPLKAYLLILLQKTHCKYFSLTLSNHLTFMLVFSSFYNHSKIMDS